MRDGRADVLPRRAALGTGHASKSLTRVCEPVTARSAEAVADEYLRDRPSVREPRNREPGHPTENETGTNKSERRGHPLRQGRISSCGQHALQNGSSDEPSDKPAACKNKAECHHHRQPTEVAPHPDVRVQRRSDSLVVEPRMTPPHARKVHRPTRRQRHPLARVVLYLDSEEHRTDRIRTDRQTRSWRSPSRRASTSRRTRGRSPAPWARLIH